MILLTSQIKLPMKNVLFLVMILSSVMSIVSCTQTDENRKSMGASLHNATDSKTVVYKGVVTIGHEVSSFLIEGDKDYWLTDETQDVYKEYDKLLENTDSPYMPVYAELKGKKSPKATDGFAAEYDGVFEVTEVIKMERIGKLEDQENR